MSAKPSARIPHVVWDWNGTLLDDFEVTSRVATTSLAALGYPGVEPEDIRRHFTRPYRVFYQRLLGRDVSDDEMARIRAAYEAGYHAEMHHAPLRSDALDALDQAEAHGSQSLLSLAPDVQLQHLVERHGLRERFVLVEGSQVGSDTTKARHLRDHLRRLEADPARTLVVGDTVDDQRAAAAVGANVVLVTGGNQPREALTATGAPVVESLTAALASLERMVSD